MLGKAKDDFDYKDCFQIFKAVAQHIEACPTQVSMVFNVTDNIVYWCDDRQWNVVYRKVIHQA